MSVGRYVKDVERKGEMLEEGMGRNYKQIRKKILLFLGTHGEGIVRQFYINTILTPTEMA